MKELTNKDNSESKVVAEVGYRDGYHFEYEIDGYNIHVHCSAKSGKEQVFVDGKKIGEKRSFGRKSTMEFSLSGNTYEIEFNMVNLLTGELHCTLIKNDTHIKTYKKALKKYNQLGSNKATLLLFFIGGFVGYYLMAELLKIING